MRQCEQDGNTCGAKQPYDDVILAGSKKCGGCGRTRPGVKYVRATLDNKTKEFYVYTVTTNTSLEYTHWSDGLSMYIIKDGIEIKLDSEEIQQLVKALPRTIGGVY